MKKVLAVGIFDGVHAGHQQIIDVAKHQGEVTIVTFDPHPTSVFAPERTPTQLVTLKDRVNLLKQAGASFVEVINFNKEFSLLSPDQFIEDILVGRFAAEHVVIGENFNFGYKPDLSAREIFTIKEELFHKFYSFLFKIFIYYLPIPYKLRRKIVFNLKGYKEKKTIHEN